MIRGAMQRLDSTELTIIAAFIALSILLYAKRKKPNYPPGTSQLVHLICCLISDMFHFLD